MSNLCFTGLRGAGKSTVSALVAAQLGRELVSTDTLVEKQSRKSITELVAQDGLEEFRRREAAAVRGVCHRDDLVVDLGGGAILDPHSRMAIRSSGVVVFLKCALPILWQRVQNDPLTPRTRPHLGGLSGLEELHQMHRDRLAIYSTCADYTVDTTAMSPEAVADAVVRWFTADDTRSNDSHDDAAADER